MAQPQLRRLIRLDHDGDLGVNVADDYDHDVVPLQLAAQLLFQHWVVQCVDDALGVACFHVDLGAVLDVHLNANLDAVLNVHLNVNPDAVLDVHLNVSPDVCLGVAPDVTPERFLHAPDGLVLPHAEPVHVLLLVC